MFVRREGAQTIKQKLDIRTSLSPMEYIHASLALVNDQRAYVQRDRDHILRHIQDVTHDCMERPWDVVRKWSQRVWDAVERKEFSWGDHQLIQNLRVSIAITGCSKSASTTTYSADSKPTKSEVICRLFNSRGGLSSEVPSRGGSSKAHAYLFLL